MQRNNTLKLLTNKQIKVLELLKVRFGEAPLQSCEVMLKDIQDSCGLIDGLDGRIRRMKSLDSTDEDLLNTNEEESQTKPSLHAKILSRLFWPQLHDENYRVPDEIGHLHAHYEKGFEMLKASRKLTWLHALGQATVELELEDRTITEDVHTWQATVIWAFQNPPSPSPSPSTDPTDPISRTVQDLVELLEMDEPLVRSALRFWVHKMVLYEPSKDTFSVLETLNTEDRARSNAQAVANTGPQTDDSGDEAALLGGGGITAENKLVYWQFVQGMLKNASSQMPLAQIAMMLKMLVPDGFPWSNEELLELLGGWVAEGGLEFVGGKYRLVKK